MSTPQQHQGSSTPNRNNAFDRRQFLKSASVAAGAGFLLAGCQSGEQAKAQPNGKSPPAANAKANPDAKSDAKAIAKKDPPVSTLNVAIIGVGKQGLILLDHMLARVPGVRILAVCDIWTYSQRFGRLRSKNYNQTVNVYEDYHEMLAKEKDLDAVVIATPDFLHHEMTNACLKAGLHVYCEKEMSNDIEKARSMVRTARETGKLLQIGHQRRSNPYYLHAFAMMTKDKFFGDISEARGQWNQNKKLRKFPKVQADKYPIPQETLDRFGFRSIAEFYEWRWFNRYAGGPMTDLGSHQVDVFNWFLQAPPVNVYAVGDAREAIAKAKAENVGFVPECFDHTLALYEWRVETGTVRGFYQVNLKTNHGGFYEEFMGSKGSMIISEISSKSGMFKEPTVEQPEWVDETETIERGGEEAMAFKPGKSRLLLGKMTAAEIADMEANLNKAPHQWHLENFFNAIRDPKNVKLTCPPEIGFETCVSVIKANESAMTGKRIDFKPEDFIA